MSGKRGGWSAAQSGERPHQGDEVGHEQGLGFAQLEVELGGGAPGARLGLCAEPLHGAGGGAQLAWRAGEAFPAASTIKVFVLQALFELVASGGLALTDQRTVRAADLVTGSGVLKALTPGRDYSLHDLATLMIIVSDNTATNVLIDVVGVDAVNACVQSRGWTATHLAGKLQTAQAQAGTKPSRSVTSPADLGDYFARLWRGELLPGALTATCQAIYRRQQHTDLGRALGYDPYSVELGAAPWRVASKSGSIRGVRNDAGVFEFEDSRTPLVLVVMTQGCADERFHPNNLGAQVVGKAAAAAFGVLAP
ncbi:MAG: serine hydrolase [Trueperaceae bacterium]